MPSIRAMCTRINLDCVIRPYTKTAYCVVCRSVYFLTYWTVCYIAGKWWYCRKMVGSIITITTIIGNQEQNSAYCSCIWDKYQENGRHWPIIMIISGFITEKQPRNGRMPIYHYQRPRRWMAKLVYYTYLAIYLFISGNEQGVNSSRHPSDAHGV